MKDYVIYRSRHPEVRDHWHATIKAEKAWWRKVRRLEREVGLKAVCLAGIGGGPGGFVAGFVWEYLEKAALHRPLRRAEVPAHMKVQRPRNRDDYLTPRMSTAGGKALQARMDEVGRCPDPRTDLPGGLPGEFGFFGSCGMEFHEGGQAVYVIFGAEPTWTTTRPREGLDEAMWERIPLSEYYRVVEDEKARGVNGLGEPVKAEAVPA